MEDNNENIVEEEYMHFKILGEFDRHIEEIRKDISFDDYCSLKRLVDYWQRQNWLDSLSEI